MLKAVQEKVGDRIRCPSVFCVIPYSSWGGAGAAISWCWWLAPVMGNDGKVENRGSRRGYNWQALPLAHMQESAWGTSWGKQSGFCEEKRISSLLIHVQISYLCPGTWWGVRDRNNPHLSDFYQLVKRPEVNFGASEEGMTCPQLSAAD